MTTWQEKTFYTLSSLLIAAAFFVLAPSHNSDLSNFQQEAKQQFTIAALQVFGDQPVFDAPVFVIQSVTEFYIRSADATIALLSPVGDEQDVMIHVAKSSYQLFKTALNFGGGTRLAYQPQVLGETTANEYNLEIPRDFMQGEPINNIASDDWIAQNKAMAEKTYAAAEAPAAEPAPEAPLEPVQPGPLSSVWMSLTDGVTGQIYCVAVFNAEVNRYMGPCKNDYK